MSHVIDFRPLTWDALKSFLSKERTKVNRDVDHDVRFVNFIMFSEQTVEGLFLNGKLVGFARWDKANGHLSNLYVMQEHRGHGIARKFIKERPIKTLYVMSQNHLAKKLYSSLGFVLSPCAVRSREFMSRAFA